MNNPPWQQREWVFSDNGRNDFIGFEFEFECKSCRDEYDFE